MDEETILVGLLRDRYRNTETNLCEESPLVAGFVKGSSSPGQKLMAQHHIASCKECQEDLNWLERLVQEGVVRQDGPISGKEPVRNGGVKISYFGRFMRKERQLLLMAVAAGVFLLGLATLIVYLSRPNELAFSLQMKGPEDDIVIAVQRGVKRFRARPNESLLPGDKLGFFYTSARSGYLILLDVQANGQVAVLVPAGGKQSVPIDAGAEIALPDGGFVEAGQGCSWLVALFSKKPLSLSMVQTVIAGAIKDRKGCGLNIETTLARTVWTHLVHR